MAIASGNTTQDWQPTPFAQILNKGAGALYSLPGQAMNQELGVTTPSQIQQPQTDPFAGQTIGVPSSNLRDNPFTFQSGYQATRERLSGGGQSAQAAEAPDPQMVQAEQTLAELQGRLRNPADRVSEPNVEQTIDAGEIAEGTNSSLPANAQRENDYQQTIDQIRAEALDIQESLRGRIADRSPESQPVRNTPEQEEIINSAAPEERQSIIEEMDEIRQQYGLPELEKERLNLIDNIRGINESYSRAIDELDSDPSIFGNLEKARIKGLQDQRDRELNNLGSVLDRVTTQIDSINTTVNQAISREDQNMRRQQQNMQTNRNELSTYIQSGAIGNFSDEQLIRLSEATGYSPDMLAQLRATTQQEMLSGQGYDATGDIGQYQDAMNLGIIPENTSYQEFVQMVNNAEGGGGRNRLMQFMQAEQYVSQNSDLSPEEMERNMRQQFDELAAGDINSIIDARQQQPITQEEYLQRVAESASSKQELGLERDEAREELRREIKEVQGYNTNEDLPDFYDDVIDQAIVATYGKGFWGRLFGN